MAKVYLLIIISVILGNVNALAQPNFIINSALVETHPTEQTDNAQAMIEQAFLRLGIQVTFRFRPDKRSIHEANSGLVDGEFARIESIDKIYPNLIVVPESITEQDIVAFAAKSNKTLSDFTLQQKGVRIGYMLGWKNVNDLLINHKNKKAIASHHTLFELLFKGRIDIALFTKSGGWKVLKQMRKHNQYAMSPSLLAYPMYLVVHKRHAELVPALALAIKEIKHRYPKNFKNPPVAL